MWGYISINFVYINCRILILTLYDLNLFMTLQSTSSQLIDKNWIMILIEVKISKSRFRISIGSVPILDSICLSKKKCNAIWSEFCEYIGKSYIKSNFTFFNKFLCQFEIAKDLKTAKMLDDCINIHTYDIHSMRNFIFYLLIF